MGKKMETATALNVRTQGRNPQTGKPLKIAAKKVAKFSVGAELKKLVNK